MLCVFLREHTRGLRFDQTRAEELVGREAQPPTQGGHRLVTVIVDTVEELAVQDVADMELVAIGGIFGDAAVVPAVNLEGGACSHSFLFQSERSAYTSPSCGM